VLAAFAGTGLGAGLVLVYYWDDITGVFGTLIPLGLEQLAALRIL
jgi:hypothetical protein